MSWDFARHLAYAFRGPGTVALESEGEVARGFLNDEDVMEEDEVGGRIYPAGTVLYLETGALPHLEAHGRLVIEGAEYRVDKPLRQGDGIYRRLAVVKVPDGQL